MKIESVTEDAITFDNGKAITYDHDQDCCENNYADFKQLEPFAVLMDFKEPLTFEMNDFGFRFGNPGNMFYIPCYSVQNGYYTRNVRIYYGDKLMGDLEAEWIDG